MYGAPAMPVWFAFMLQSVFLVNFAVDTLLIAPVVISTIFGASRLWDAVSDPLAGYFSDRTRSRLGRRRSWLLVSIPVLAVGFSMTWSPPDALSGTDLTVWVGVGIFLFYTGTTLFTIPYESLGAEMTSDHHDRTRVFGVKQLVAGLGSMAAVGGIYYLVTADDKREAGGVLAIIVSVACCVLIGLSVWALRERSEYQGRGSTKVLRAFRDVLANPHAVPLLFVFFIENFGMAMLAAMAPFLMKYVYNSEEMTPLFLGMYIVPSLLFIPLWIRISRTVGKRRLWLFATATLAVGFSLMYFASAERIGLFFAIVAIVGIGGGCGQVVGPSIQADVIDWDEAQTGERKEGTYFAAWNLADKAAGALSVGL
ncbi:MAG: MFS transporter, partial [Myxococcota bacterium]|nr:MFS transporter [Myxococcota bacterium]